MWRAHAKYTIGVGETHLVPGRRIVGIHSQPDPNITSDLSSLLLGERLFDDAVAELHEVVDHIV